ncbi:MAG: SDR family NAD(P)-dependent oxidoreductase [Pikeienuella sp.]
MTSHNSPRIAIVGRAGRFPGAPDVPSFWKMLAEGRSGAERLGEAELLAAGVSRKTLADPDYVRVSHPLADMECFDAGFWGFSPREAAILDPQHRHFLECAWEALEDAGHMPENFDGRVGVFAGSGMQAYLPFNLLSNPDLVEEIGLFLLRHTGNDKDFLPTRLSYLLNLTGPAVAVQTACSTSLVAVHSAANALLNMECDMALAGGVTIELPHRTGYRYAEGEILSPDGVCRAFDDESQGTVFGSGAALLVLRRYEDALADGDDIKAVILATAINNDGAGKASYLAPSVDGQAECAAEAVALAGVDPSSISYIETHGTGTPIGDPIELSALGQAYDGVAPGGIGVGSVKTNIGHLDTAAGGASLIKVVEAMRHGFLPASLNFNKPNSRFDFDASPFRVVAEGRPWEAGAEPRRAAVNSLGVGGTNAHVIVEEAPARPRSDDASARAWRLFPFSARDKDALARSGEKWGPFLAGPEAPGVADIAFTLREGRREFPERLVVAARDETELAEGIAARNSTLARRGRAGEAPPRILFLFPGGGAQYPGAGAGMMAQSPVFAEAVEACFAALPSSAPADLREMMFERAFADEEAREKLARSGYAIPALFILEHAYARLWESWGVTPDAIFAHSVGEYACAVAAGTMELADALRIVTLRGQVMDAAPSGAMTTVPVNAERARELIGDGLDIAAINAPQATVVSGRLADIEALETRLAGCGHQARRIHIDVAAHSRQLDGQLEAFRAGFEGVDFREPRIPVVSSLTGGWAGSGDLASADYWVRHLRHTVRFTDAMSAALADPNAIVIEVGPGQTLGPLVELVEEARQPRAILYSGLRPRDQEDEMGAMLASFGGLWAHGVPLDWSKAVPAEGRRASLPTYAFEKTRHWIAPGRGAAAAAEEEAAPALSRIEDPSDWIESFDWVEAPRPARAERPAGQWLVLAGEDPVSAAVLRDLRAAGASPLVLRPGPAFRATEEGFELRPDAAEDFDALAEALGDAPSRMLALWSLSPTVGDLGFAGAYLLARMLQMTGAGEGGRLVLASGGAAPAQRGAMLLGIARVAPREIPGLEAVHVDLAPGADIAGAARALLEEAGPGDSADQVALRGGRRFVLQRRKAARKAPDGLPARLRRGGAYLITGGNGGIGRALALWLAETAGARVGLLSRRAVEDEALSARIRAAGGEAAFFAADVTDEAAMARAIAAFRDRFGEINGVIHAAGAIADAPFSAKTLAETRAVIAPKLDGAEILSGLLPEGVLDFFCVISSSSVAIGAAGQADYVAANAAIEALAASRVDGLSVAWGVWRDIGMAARSYGAGDGAAGEGDHPLLGARRDGRDGEFRFERLIDPAGDWRVAEHVVAGRPVLPGSAYIELAQAAGAAILGARPFEMRALSFAQPMIFAAGLPRRATVALRPVAEGYDLSIESAASAGEAPVEHMRVQIAATRKADARPPATLAGSPALSPSPRSGRAPQAERISFGPRWRNVGAVSAGGDAVEGRFALPAEFRADLADHPLHPALLDMAATVGLNTLTAAESEGVTYVPMSADRVRVLAPLPAEVTASARRTGGTARKFAAFDAIISDAAGKPVMIIEKLAMRAVEDGAFAEAGPAPSLTDQLLATGIREAEAPAIFARVFDHPHRRIVASPVSLDLARLSLAEARRPARDAAGKGGKGGATIGGDPVATRIADIWGEILGVDGIGAEDDFFALGGHSLNAVRMFGRLRKEWGVNLPLATLFEAPTVGALAALVAETAGIAPAEDAPAAPADSVEPAARPAAREWSPLVTIARGADGVRPFYCVHGAGGNILNFRPLAGVLDPSIPFLGLRARGSDGGPETDGSIEEMAARYLEAVRVRQPEGPYRLAGYSGGGVIAFEMAQQLRAEGEEVEHLVLLDTLAAHVAKRGLTLMQKLWAARKWDLQFALEWRARRKRAGQARDNAGRISALLEAGQTLPDDLTGPRMTAVYNGAQNAYEARPYDGRVSIFRARKAGTLFLNAGERLGWDGLLTGDVAAHVVDCDHFTLMEEPAISGIGAILNRVLLAKG